LGQFDDYSYSNSETGTEVTITSLDGHRYITSNGLPDHDTGEFSNSGNPNTITQQNYEYRVTLSPQKNSSSAEVKVFGITTGGVFLNLVLPKQTPQ